MSEQPRKSLSVEEIVSMGKTVRPRRNVDLCVNGELVSDIEDLNQRLQVARADARGRGDNDPGPERGLSEPDDVASLEAELDDKLAEAEGYKRTLWLRAMPEDEWKALWAKHADPDTGTIGLASPLWAEAVARCAEDPVLTVEQVRQLQQTLAPSQWDTIRLTCQSLNTTGGVDVPKSSRPSAAATRPLRG